MSGPPPRFAPCPAAPNCVSSRAADETRRVEPIAFGGATDDAWCRLRRAVSSLPRTVIVEDDGHHLRAECRTALFRFVDDLEVEIDEDRVAFDVRSASRTGWWDLGCNRRRVERLRRLFAEADAPPSG